MSPLKLTNLALSAGQAASPAQAAQETKPTPPAPKPAKPKAPPQVIPPEFRSEAIIKMQSPELIAILKNPSSSVFQKSKACMRLAQVGTRDAVPVLASMLNDPKFSHYARYGLVPIPDPSVDDALRAALSTVKGTLLVGVIDSIAERRDAKAVEPLTAFLYGSDAPAAHAAAAALGRISGASAKTVLLEALGKTKEPLRTEVAHACLVCAEELMYRGDRSEALSLYTRMTGTDVPKPIRLGAMNTIITAETSPTRPK